MDWFRYDNDLRHERVKQIQAKLIRLNLANVRSKIWR